MSRKTLTIILIISIGINLGLLGFMGYGCGRTLAYFP